MKMYIVICAGEGDTRSVFAALGTPDDLKRVIREGYDRECENEPSGRTWDGKDLQAENCRYSREQQAAYLAMLDQHADWSCGAHVLENVEPVWEENTLVIADQSCFVTYQ